MKVTFVSMASTFAKDKDFGGWLVCLCVCVLGVFWLVVLDTWGFGFFCFLRKFLHSGFHLEAPTIFCTALVFCYLNLSLYLMPLSRCHQLQVLSSFCYFYIPCSGESFTHATFYVVPLVPFHHLFQIPFWPHSN